MSSGYENAPISSLLTMIVVGLSLALRSSAVTLDLFRLVRGEFWRLISSFLVFQNIAQLSVGMILLYTCRQFERQMGSRKFGAFLVFTYMISVLVSVAAVTVASSVGYYLVPSSGPFSLIYGLLMFYYWHVPKLHSTQYAVLGMDLSEKSWIYLVAAQLLFSDGVPSVVSGLSGMLAGYLYEADGFGLQSFRLPSVVEGFFSVIGTSVLSLLPDPSARPAAANPNTAAAANGNTNGGTRQNLMMGQQGPATRQGQAGGLWGDLQNFQNPHGDFGAPTMGPGAARMPRAPAPVVPPSEESIEMLMGMGFGREEVVRALQSTGNNVEAAANTLLR